ncbi:uncharacterized protein LOC121652704 [Melanotaenia boesemani]|uniref:uncharacterized protein LOC121652704 n=1 Tax=Melanotaenia boesemani TaxID=1250792 RepID=UPI001C04B3EE|nr:uncharacterized protein LOC121652704 [Melanotaenia boesemani]XP_041861559.1 uncharacterized protein LOC121652704 [Melanotaenia boesemani]
MVAGGSDDDPHTPGLSLVESLAHQSSAIPVSFQEELDGSPLIPSMSADELRQKQVADPAINAVVVQLESGQSPPPSLRAELPELPLLLRELNRLEMQNGVLYRRRQAESNLTYQLVLPEELRSRVLRSLHNDMGHLGVERTVDMARARFYWPKMQSTIEKMIKTCERCVRRKTPPERASLLVNIKTCRPLELVCMDFLSVEPDRSNTKDILVITDHFTKYAVAIPTPNQRARTVAKCLWENFIAHYGFPEKLHSDQGPDFESKTIKELCELAGMRKVRTTPYHPRGNPVERFNRTLLQMLGTLDQSDKLHWKDFVKPLVHAYNCTKNDTTGFSPYELMFGRQPRLPIDLALGLPVNAVKHTHSQYVRDLKSRLEESYKIAASNAGKTADRNKIRFDKRVVDSTLEEGDRVLVRNVKLRGKNKLADKWEESIYTVLKRAGDMPVYTVKPENKEGPVRTLHRDLLLPCGFLPAAPEHKPDRGPPARRPKTRHRLDSEVEEDGDDSESESPSSWPLSSHPVIDPDSVVTVVETHKWSNPLCEEVLEPNPETLFVPTVPDTPSVQIPVEKEPEVAVQDLPDVDNPPEEGFLPAEEIGILPEPGSLVNLVLPEITPPSTDLDSTREPLPEKDEADPAVADVEEEHDGNTVVTEQPQSIQSRDDRCHDVKPSLRRSQRKCERPEKLQYSKLGSPLLMVVNSLFQGLSEALASSLVQ